MLCFLPNPCRSLASKRRELAELKEQSKIMKAQIRTRKQNVATLETMLLNAKSGSSRRRSSSSRDTVKPEATEPAAKPTVIRFFVTGPDGLCVEFNERAETMVGDVVLRARHAFQQSAPNNSNSNNNNNSSNNSRSGRRRSANDEPPRILSCKLIYQGRLLLEDRTLELEGVRMGDTVVAVVKYQQEQEESPERVVKPDTVPIAPQTIGSGMPDLSEFLGKQQETLRDVAVEMRYQYHCH